MATLTMEQDTDLKRFIEDRKQRYYDNDKAAVFATSLPLSNNGVEDRRSQLRDERHRDYQRYLERKHQDESERNRTRYSPSRPQVPAQPRPGDIDYSQMKQELADERKRDYQDYLQQQEHMYVRAQQENGIPVLDRTPREENSYVTSKPPPCPGAYRQRDERESEKYRPHADELPPPGPSDFPKGHHYNSDEYEKYRKDLQQKQHAEYQDFLQKKYDPPKDAIGLPIGQYRYEPKRLAMEAERNKEYNELQKNKESVKLSESSQGLPIGPYRYRDKIHQMESQRNKEYNEYLQKKYRQPDTTRSNQQPTSFYMGDDSVHEDKKRQMRRERNYEYNKMLSERQQKGRPRSVPITFDELLGFPIGQNQQYEKRTFLAKERNKEYNQFLQALEHPMHRGERFSQSWNEFQTYLTEKQMSDPPRFGRNTPPVVGPYSGIFAGLGQYDLDKQRLKKERQSEYSNYLDKTYAEKGRPYGRPTWAKDIDDSEQYPARPYSYEHRSNPETKPRDHLPPIEGQGQGNRRPPSYEDMLAKNRQKEADRRRYDPGFAPRDDRYEAERNGPARDGDYAPRDGGYGGDGNQGQDQYRY